MAKKPPKVESNGAAKPGDEPAPKACYVLSLEIENVRCFGPKQKLDFTDGKGNPAQWTVILGENGTGKTTILQSLSCWEKPSAHLLNKAPRRQITLLGYEDGGVVGSDAYSCIRRSDQSLSASCRLTYTESSKLSNINHSNLVSAEWRVTPPSGFFAPSTTEIIPNIKFYAYGAGRRLSYHSFAQDHDDDPTGTLFDDHAPLRNAEDRLLRLDYALKTSKIPTAVEWLEKVKRLLISILPDVVDIRFQTTTGPNPRQWVEFRTFSGWVPLHRLGYGYQTLVAWVLDFVSRMVERYPDSPDPLNEPAIVLVDEIDLHLHPAWQRKLIAFLTERFPNTQFIVTAHSPLIVQAVEDANIVVLKRVGDHVEIINDPDQVRGWGVDQILTSNLFDLKSARPPHVEKLLTREQELLAKSKLTKAEQRELKEIQDKIEKLPVGNNAQSTKEMKAIRDALDLLMKNSPP